MKNKLWILLFLPFLLGATYVCGTGTSISKRRSCGRACSQNPNCVKIDASESIVNKKIEAGQLIALTQQEIDDAIAIKIALVEQAEIDRLKAIDDSMDSIDMSEVKLLKVEKAIDNIGNLADAKAFLKKLCRYIITIQRSN